MPLSLCPPLSYVDVVTETVVEFVFMMEGANSSEQSCGMTETLMENHRLFDLKHQNTE